MGKREHKLSVRVSESEREAIKDRAAATGLDVSEHVRRSAMAVMPIVAQVPAVIEGELVRPGRMARLLRLLRRPA